MYQQSKKRVTVCGGGVMGVCTAYYISKNYTGAAVTLVERKSYECAGAGKAGGFLAVDWSDQGPISELSCASFNLHHSLANELNGHKTYGYMPLTTFSLTVNEPNEKGSGYGGSGSKSPRSVLPDWVDGPTEALRMIGTAQTTAQIDPQLFTKKLLSEAVEKYKLEVVTGKVERVGIESGKVSSVVLEGGRVIDSDAVVMALGSWTGKLEMLSSMFRVNGVKTQSIVLEPKEAAAMTPHALFLSYNPAHGGRPMDAEVFPQPTGEVYICGIFSQEDVPDDLGQIVGNPESIAALKQLAGTVSTQLSGEVKEEHPCFLPCTDDGLPIIGEISDIKGCYVATGHGRWGALNGPATGAALAELVMDGHAKVVDISKFSPARFVSGKQD